MEEKLLNTDRYQHKSLELQREQLRIAKKQLLVSRVIVVLLLCMTLTIGICAAALTPKMNSILKNLNEISQEINDQSPIDIESLNDAIQNLETVLEPLSNLLSLAGKK